MPHLKGIATIQLFNAETGELEKEVKEENMITNAIEDVLNPPDYIITGWDLTTDRSVNVRNRLNPISSNFFGGVLIFQDKIPEDATRVFPAFDYKEIGHAGYTNAVSGSQYSNIGTYNMTESGELFDSFGNRYGIRRVWDFATDRANGDIGCICLTSRAGGHVGEERQQDFFLGGAHPSSHENVNTDLWCTISEDRQNLSVNTTITIFYTERCDDGNVKMLGKGSGNSIIYEIILKDPFKQGLFSSACEISINKVFQLGTERNLFWNWKDAGLDEYPGDAKAYDILDELREHDKTLDANYTPYVYQNKIHIMYTVCHRVKYAIRHLILNIDTYEIEQDKIITLKDAMPWHWWEYGRDTQGTDGTYRNSTAVSGYIYQRTNNHVFFYFDGHYFFNSSSLDGSIAVANENGETVQILEKAQMRSVYIDEQSNYVIIETGWDNDKKYIRKLKKKDGKYTLIYGRVAAGGYSVSSNTEGSYFIKVKESHLPFYLKGAIRSTDNYGKTSIIFYYGYMYTFLSSINNLATPVKKTDGQTMKITYDIIQME